MDELALSKWNQSYRKRGQDAVAAARVLRDNRHLLSDSGDALDLACGLGGNAIELARLGYRVQAWDISDEAIARLGKQADTRDLPIAVMQRDVVAEPPAAESFDLIVASRFLHRALCPALSAALKPGGLLFYQTFIADKPGDGGPSNPEYLLQPNELLALFGDLQVRFYREDARCGDLQDGFRNEAMLVAQRAPV